MTESIPVDAFYYAYASHPEAGLHLRNDGDIQRQVRFWDKKVQKFVTGGEALVKSILIHGHVLASDYLPAVPNANFMTWVRDPVQRLASHYYFWRKMEYPFDPDWKEFSESKWSLAEFATHPKHRNLHAKYLAGLDIERMRFVGVVERFEESLRRFRRIFGVDVAQNLVGDNRNPDKKEQTWPISADVEQEIRQVNQLDCEIYDRALAMIERV
jgi:hypothetical protein